MLISQPGAARQRGHRCHATPQWTHARQQPAQQLRAEVAQFRRLFREDPADFVFRMPAAGGGPSTCASMNSRSVVSRSSKASSK